MLDVYIVFTVTTGIRALEPWLATRAPGRATGSAYIGYRDNGDMRRHWLKVHVRKQALQSLCSSQCLCWLFRVLRVCVLFVI